MSPAFIPNLHQLTVSSELHSQFEALLEGKYNYKFGRGDIVTGTVLDYDTNQAIIDIGAKTNATLSVKELMEKGSKFSDELVIGQPYEFYILRDADDEGVHPLSRKRVGIAQAWKDVESLAGSEEIFECPVLAVVKGGLLVEFKGLRGFVPSSHLRQRNNLEELIGQTLPLKLLVVDATKNNIILSHKKVVSDQHQEHKREMMTQITVGTIREGKVVRITEFGAFVDLGGVDGLLPLSQMSWRWVEHPSDILSLGDTVKVEVISVDVERNRISLSSKTLMKDPWQEVAENYKLYDKIDGKITRIKQFGAFVEIFPGVEALLPGKELDDYNATAEVKADIGMVIPYYITKFQPEERRISLSFNPPHGYEEA
jgi:ribosomal protein S1